MCTGLVIGSATATGASATDASAPAPSFSAFGSAEQVYVTGLAPSAQASLITPTGQTVYTQKPTRSAGLLFRNVPPGSGYRVLLSSDGEGVGAPHRAHRSAAPWDPEHLQPIDSRTTGTQYLTTRDGTKLAIDVHPPTSPAGEPGLPPGTPVPERPIDYLPPYPTLIEYSGYGYADPAGPDNGIAILANLMGFAVVDVNMRGTGCSGGAFDFFEPLQNLDGYDVIETIAHQPWVLDHKVGMMGISYGAISQLFVPHSSIRPTSRPSRRSRPSTPRRRRCIPAASSTQVLRSPGPSSGRRRPNRPDPTAGSPGRTSRSRTATRRVRPTRRSTAKRPTCMSEDRRQRVLQPGGRRPAGPGHLRPTRSRCRSFMACQWEDEQTGGHCPELVQHFTGTSKKWFTFTNGAHIDSLDPATFDRWYDFLELFVAHQAPIVNSAVIQAAAPVIYQ